MNTARPGSPTDVASVSLWPLPSRPVSAGISSPEPKLPQLVEAKANAASFDAESAPLSSYILQVGG